MMNSLLRQKTPFKLSGALLIGLCLQCRAEPIVIYDTGKTRPITDHVFVPTPKSLPQIKSIPRVPGPDDLISRLFPIRTPELTPGDVRPRQVHLPQLPRPLFLVGADNRSRQWLIRHRQRLREIGATGMVVDADSEQAVRAIEDIAEGLDLVPAQGSALAKQLELEHYPVLISRERIEQ